MISRSQYTESFRQQALEKVYTRGSGTVRAVAEDFNMSLSMRTTRCCVPANKLSDRERKQIVAVASAVEFAHLPLGQIMQALGIMPSFSRPSVSNDNPLIHRGDSYLDNYR